MPKRTVKKARLSVSLTVEQKALLREMAERGQVSLTRVIQEAVKEFIERHPERQLSLFERPLAFKG